MSKIKHQILDFQTENRCKNDVLMEKILNVYSPCLIGKKSKSDIIALFGKTTHDYGQELIYDCVDVTDGKIICFRVRFDLEKVVNKMFYVDCGRVSIDK